MIPLDRLRIMENGRLSYLGYWVDRGRTFVALAGPSSIDYCLSAWGDLCPQAKLIKRLNPIESAALRALMNAADARDGDAAYEALKTFFRSIHEIPQLWAIAGGLAEDQATRVDLILQGTHGRNCPYGFSDGGDRADRFAILIVNFCCDVRDRLRGKR